MNNPSMCHMDISTVREQSRLMQVDGTYICSPYTILEESAMTSEEVEKVTEDAISKYRQSV